MGALGTGFATFTLLTAGQLFQVTVQLIDLPAHGILILNVLRGERAGWVVADHPLNVTVWGDHLESLHAKGHFLEFHRHALLKRSGVPRQVL